MGFIYKITSLTGGVYIGRTKKDVQKRWDEHRNELKRGVHANKLLLRDYSISGFESFSFEVLEEVENEDLVNREYYWMNKFNNEGYFLYNMTDFSGSRHYHKRREDGMNKLVAVSEYMKKWLATQPT